MNNFNQFRGPQDQEDQDQIIIPSRLRVSQNGNEMLDFVISMGAFELSCTCAIPDEGTFSAPVYIRARPRRPRFTRRSGSYSPVNRSQNQQMDRGNPNQQTDRLNSGPPVNRGFYPQANRGNTVPEEDSQDESWAQENEQDPR